MTRRAIAGRLGLWPRARRREQRGGEALTQGGSRADFDDRGAGLGQHQRSLQVRRRLGVSTLGRVQLAEQTVGSEEGKRLARVGGMGEALIGVLARAAANQ
jgi:hypothetical protein